jgi:hypothetical protein
VLDHGQVVGLGKHDELLMCCPLYRSIWEAHKLGQAEDALASPSSYPPAALASESPDDLVEPGALELGAGFPRGIA